MGEPGREQSVVSPYPMIGEQLGVGALFGFCVGYAAKKITRLAAIVLGLTFILIQILASYHLVTPHWDRVHELGQSAASSGLVGKAASLLTRNLPFGASFTVGLVAGFRMG